MADTIRDKATVLAEIKTLKAALGLVTTPAAKTKRRENISKLSELLKELKTL